MPDNKIANDAFRGKKLLKHFKISVVMNSKFVQYLDIEFNLSASTVSLYMKPKTVLKYVSTNSNHPGNVIRHMPRSVECNISRNWSKKEIFEGKKERIYRSIEVVGGT